MIKATAVPDPRTRARIRAQLFCLEEFVRLSEHPPIPFGPILLASMGKEAGFPVVLSETFLSWFPGKSLAACPDVMLSMNTIRGEATNAEILELAGPGRYTHDVTTPLPQVFRLIRDRTASYWIQEIVHTTFFFVESEVVTPESEGQACINRHNRRVVLRTVDVSLRNEEIVIDADTIDTDNPWSRGTLCVLGQI